MTITTTRLVGILTPRLWTNERVLERILGLIFGVYGEKFVPNGTNWTFLVPDWFYSFKLPVFKQPTPYCKQH